MKRWKNAAGGDIENPAIDAFIEAVIEVCRTHGFSISHEDHHGAFNICRADEFNFDWLRNAADGTDEPVIEPPK